MGNDKGFGKAGNGGTGHRHRDDDGSLAATPLTSVTFTIRGVELTANDKFIDAHWLPLYKMAAEAPLAAGETYEGREQAAWHGLCKILPGAKQHAAKWSQDGALILSIYELVDVIGWAGEQLERRKGMKELIDKQKAKPGFAELLAEQSVGMVNLEGAEVEANQILDAWSGEPLEPGEITDQAGYERAIAEGRITELTPSTQAEVASKDAEWIGLSKEEYDEIVAEEASIAKLYPVSDPYHNQESPDTVRQGEIERLRAELARLGG